MKRKICIIVGIIIVIVLVVLFNIKLNHKENNIDKNKDIIVEDIINDTDKDINQEEILDDSVIGTLTIPKINLNNVNICESVELETLAHSIGHFENTNIYDGNVGLASHNAGTKANYFANINKLEKGDEIYYKTRYGTKEYIVDNITQIDSYDWSKLEQTEDNRITLITCISGNTSVRLCVQGIEKQ